MNFLRGPRGNRQEGCPYMCYCGDFSEVHIKLSSCSLPDFGQETVLIFSDSKSEGWEKNWTYQFGEL